MIIIVVGVWEAKLPTNSDRGRRPLKDFRGRGALKPSAKSDSEHANLPLLWKSGGCRVLFVGISGIPEVELANLKPPRDQLLIVSRRSG